MIKLNYGYLIKWDFILQMSKDFAKIFWETTQNDVFDISWKSAKGRIKTSISFLKANMGDGEFSQLLIIEEAYLDCLCFNYESALKRLQWIIDFFNENKVPKTESVYEVRKLTGDIAMIMKDYDRAISEYLISLEIIEKLKYKSCVDVLILLSKAYSMKGDLNKALDVEEMLLRDFWDNDYCIAEISYIMAYRFSLLGYKDNATNLFNSALKRYDRLEISGAKKNVGKARVFFQYGIMLFEEEPYAASSFIKKAYNLFNYYLGKEHPETKECYELLQKCKPYLKDKKQK